MHALHDGALPELCLRHSANARRTLVVHVLSKGVLSQSSRYGFSMPKHSPSSGCTVCNIASHTQASSTSQ